MPLMTKSDYNNKMNSTLHLKWQICET